jgi:FkbM family methyltransferase
MAELIEVDGHTYVERPVRANRRTFYLLYPIHSLEAALPQKPSQRFFEFDVLRYLNYVIRTRKICTVIDVGALFGNHALWFDQISGVQTISFEASVEAGAAYRLNIERNRSKAILHNNALSNVNGTLMLTMPGCHFGGASVQKDSNESSIAVSAKRLDDVTEIDQIIAPCLIKIDVEGHELEVLEGAKDFLERMRPDIFLEVHLPNRTRYRAWMAEHDYHPIARIGKNEHYSRSSVGKYRYMMHARLCAIHREMVKRF